MLIFVKKFYSRVPIVYAPAGYVHHLVHPVVSPGVCPSCCLSHANIGSPTVLVLAVGQSRASVLAVGQSAL